MHKFCECLKLYNYVKTHGSSKGVVPHYIEGHQKNHILNHKKWDKLSQRDWNTSSNFKAQIQSAFGVTISSGKVLG